MRNKIIVEESFRRPAKRLAKKYKSFPNDLLELIEELEQNALLGTSLGGSLRKIRLAVRSKGKGKSGGVRIISFVILVRKTVHLLTV
jgi:mRNA-degrading endonuclease RelE of RelBE toxin-antitoxin system